MTALSRNHQSAQPSHPRYMELYNRWRAQLTDPKPYKQFAAFVRAVLVHES